MYTTGRAGMDTKWNTIVLSGGLCVIGMAQVFYNVYLATGDESMRELTGLPTVAGFGGIWTWSTSDT